MINLRLNLLVSNWSITPWALAATEAATRHDDHTAAAAVTARTENGLPAIITLMDRGDATKRGEGRRDGRRCPIHLTEPTRSHREAETSSSMIT